MNERAVQKMLGPMGRQLKNMLVRGTLVLANAAGKMQRLQVRLLAGEGADELDHFEPYGFTSKPQAGAEVLATFFDGDKSHGAVICVADRRWRLRMLEDGEVALHDDQGQKVHLTRDGIVIDGGGKQVTITNTPKVRIESSLDVTGEIKDRCDAAGTTMANMRTVYNTHTHPETGSTTNVPNQGM